MTEFHLLGRVSILLSWCLINTSQLAADSIVSELNSGQKCQVKDGSQVVVTENIEGKPWPRIKVYRLINASPEQVAAVFFFYYCGQSFFTHVLKSGVYNRI